MLTHLHDIFHFSSSPAKPEVAPRQAAEPGVPRVQVHPQILALSPMSDKRDTSQSPDAGVERNDVIIDINQTRYSYLPILHTGFINVTILFF